MPASEAAGCTVVPSASSTETDKGDTALAAVGSLDTVYTATDLAVVGMPAVAETVAAAVDSDSPVGKVAEHSPRKSDCPIVQVAPAMEVVAAPADSYFRTTLDDSTVKADRSVAASSLPHSLYKQGIYLFWRICLYYRSETR